MQGKCPDYIWIVAGLEETLKIGIGARVMLRRNLEVKSGLVNGSLGVVTDITFDDRNSVSRIVVQFDNKPKPIPIERVRADFELSKGIIGTRKQFPLVLHT